LPDQELVDEEPDIKGYIQKETMAGLFRAWKLNEIHLELTSIVNELLVADISQIIKKSGLNENRCLDIINECVVMGLLCENHVMFKDEEDIYLYMVDTGGIFALEEAGINYQKLNYTISFDQRLKIYRRNVYLVENKNLLEKEDTTLHFFEDLLGSEQTKKYYGATILVDMNVAEKQGLTDQVTAAVKAIASRNNATIYDTGQKKYIDNK